jgi:integrase
VARSTEGSITDLGPVGPVRDRRHTWRVRVQVDGQRIDRRIVGTRTEALAALAAHKAGAQPTSVSVGTVGLLLDRWIEHQTPRLSPNTVRSYRWHAGRDLAHLRPIPLGRLKTADLDALYDAMMARGLAPGSVRRAHAVMRSALAQACKWGLVERNVAELATPPSLPQHEIVPPSNETARALVAEAERQGPDIGAFVRLAAVTGARRAEMCGLQWADLDGNLLTVRRSIVVDAGVWTVQPTKNRSTRGVTLDTATVETLDLAGRDGPWMFGGVAPWLPDYASYRWEKVRAAVPGAGKVRLHDLRHWCATVVRDSFSDETAGRRLGHRDASTTLRIYAHPLAKSDAAAADLLGSVLAGK